MKLAERNLCQGVFSSFFQVGGAYADEAMRSPDEDLSGVLIGRFSRSIVSKLTQYGTGEGKTFHQYKDYDLLIEILGSFGLALAAATCLGKEWKNCTLEVSNGLVFGILHDRLSKTPKGRSYLILLAILGVFTSAALQKYRNPSLGIKPYLVHGLACFILTQFVYTLLVGEQLKNRVTTNKDVHFLVFVTFIFCTSYLSARGIQKVVGKDALKFNWKVTTVYCAGLAATNLLFLSERSPLYES